MRYPDARRLDVVDELHGHRIPDPYRWLEDPTNPDCEAWSRAQDALTSEHLGALPGRAALAARLRQLTPGMIGPPTFLGDRAFYLRRDPDQEHPVVCVRAADGQERVLVDPAALDPSLTTTLDGVAPSKEGDRLACLLSEGGREESTLRILDVATGALLDGPIDVGRASGVAWLPGGEEYVYIRGKGQFDRRIVRRRLGGPEQGDDVLFGEGRDRGTYYSISTSRDGRWLVVDSTIGTAPRNDLHLLDLESGRWTVLQEGLDAQTRARVHHDGRLYLLTNRDAPRWRLCVTRPEDAGAGPWPELLPETGSVLAGYTVIDGAVVAVRTVDVVSRVTVHDADSGERVHEVPLPGLGSATVTSRPEGGDDLWIGYTDHATPYTVLHWRPGDDAPAVWAEPPGAPRISGVGARQVFVTSADGTRLPMFVLAPAAAEPGTPRPTILYGYGGFNVSLEPAYSAQAMAWVEAGGVYAVANLRGGGEYGEEWHRQGMRQNKQNVFDDFLACAHWLLAQGWTDRHHLAISGGSNGGLLMGAALTRKPELFAAVLCSAPLLDMVRYERFGLGETWNDEYGRADDPVELEWLLSYSPYHHVRHGSAYPAVLFTVFEGDTRVDPLHARKMCAALQHATSADPGDRPVLIRRETDVGHGARALSRTIDLGADGLAFLAAHTGLRWPEG